MNYDGFGVLKGPPEDPLFSWITEEKKEEEKKNNTSSPTKKKAEDKQPMPELCGVFNSNRGFICEILFDLNKQTDVKLKESLLKMDGVYFKDREKVDTLIKNYIESNERKEKQKAERIARNRRMGYGYNRNYGNLSNNNQPAVIKPPQVKIHKKYEYPWLKLRGHDGKVIWYKGGWNDSIINGPC